MPESRSRTSTAGRNMAGARALWRATGMKDGDFEKPIIAIANSFTQFVPGHVHLKDADAGNKWQALGRGICGIGPVLALLENEIGYSGWIVGEEESADAWSDPVGAIGWNRRYLKSLGY